MRKKSKKKAEFSEFEQGLRGTPQLAGRWKEGLPEGTRLTVELGAGRCDFALGYAAQFPHHFVLAVDLKSERLWAGARRAVMQGLTNVLFLRASIEQLGQFLAPGEVDQLWLTFPDPFPKARHEKHRMTGPRFLSLYRQLLRPGGLVKLKTDNPGFFLYTLQTVRATAGAEICELTRDLHRSPLRSAENGIMTFYEEKWLMEHAARIHYMSFRLS